MLGLLVGCGLRRSELAGLTCDRIQQREGRWVIVDLQGNFPENSRYAAIAFAFNWRASLSVSAFTYATSRYTSSIVESGSSLEVRPLSKLNQYLLKIRDEVLPKSPAARAVRYALNQWDALTRFLQDGDLEIDNGHGAGQSRHRHWPRKLDVY